MNKLPIVIEDHLLWPDGSISVIPEEVVKYVYRMNANGDLSKLFVTELTPEIKKYNEVSDVPIKVKSECDEIDLRWILPDHYKYLDLDEYLLKLADKIEKDKWYEQRVERLCQEIWMFRALNLDEVLRTLIYVIDVMTEKNVIWGVGRGSSCSSYLLFLLGLHEVDPVRYGIEITDFIRSTGD